MMPHSVSYAAAAVALLLTAQSPAPATAPHAGTPSATASTDCPHPAVDTHRFLAAHGLALKAPGGMLSLVAVSNEQTRARGLMCVVRVPSGKGMIFVFPPPEGLQNFWMKNTLVALDMVFVGANGVVNDVAASVPPTPAGTADNRVGRRAGLGQYVIELGAGDAARRGIVRGTKFALPALAAQH